MSPRTPRVRRWIGWACLYGIHLFPATPALLPFIGPAVWAGARLEERAPLLARVAQVTYYAFATLCALTLGRVVPFLAPADWILAAAAAIAVTIATSSRVAMNLLQAASSHVRTGSRPSLRVQNPRMEGRARACPLCACLT